MSAATTPLADGRLVVHPWPHFISECGFTHDELEHFHALFHEASEWDQHASSLYDGMMNDATRHVDAERLRALSRRVATLFDVPLTPRVHVNLQRMEPGQNVRVHSDVPLLGYETVRLVLQLGSSMSDAAWQPGDGGVLQLHPDAAGQQVAHTVAPVRGSSVGFLLTPDGFHSVSRTHRVRRSVVFYFWHIGNTEALRDALVAFYAALDFSTLPAGVDAVSGDLSEAQSLRASIVAWTLGAWGYSDAVALEGYRADMKPDETRGDSGPEYAITLARWAAALHCEHFDIRRWERLQHLRESACDSAGARAFQALAFPSAAAV